MKIKEILSALSLMTVLAVSLAPANAQMAPSEGKCDSSCIEALRIFFLELKPECRNYECKEAFDKFVQSTPRWAPLCGDCNFKELYDTYRKTNKRPYPYDME